MNTFSTSPSMTLNMVRYAPTSPAEQAQARASLKAMKAEQRRARRVGRNNPWAALGRRFAGPATTPSPSRPLIAH